MADILLIEDDLAEGERMAAALSQAGHQVRRAASALEGLALQAAIPSQLVITDVYMPGMDGLAVITVLRQRGDPVPIIALSDGPREQSERLSLMLARCRGARAALAKPLAPEELWRAVAEALESPA